MYKISIICPTYNCEKYIKRTIKSIQNQTIGFENLELIFVDDLSADETPNIIKEFTLKHENIKLFESKENHKAPGFGRNYGIKQASADYIMFIDNDDEYEPDFCEVMYNRITSEDVDVVSANHKTMKALETVKIPTFNSVDKFSKIENGMKFVDLTELFYLKGTEVWSKIFKKEIIKNNNIKFIEDGLNEDTIFLHEYYYYAKTLLYIDYYGYKWHRDGENLSYYTTSSTVKYIDSYYQIYDILTNLYEDVDVEELFRMHIEWALIRSAFSYENKKELNCLLIRLYEFEKKIQYDGILNHKWSTILNKLLLNKHLKIVSISLILMRKLKYLIDSLKRAFA